MSNNTKDSKTDEQKIEAGKEIVRQMLAKLAHEFHEPKIKDLKLNLTHKDFDLRRISLTEPTAHRIVAKIEINDLADSTGDAAVRKKLEAQLRRAVHLFYTPPKT
ncbi:MAG: hypothetical protein HY648_09145 [Acidobacteria bacterium]|nr:hypothetical protein [Acidobacteriota bacterium]